MYLQRLPITKIITLTTFYQTLCMCMYVAPCMPARIVWLYYTMYHNFEAVFGQFFFCLVCGPLVIHYYTLSRKKQKKNVTGSEKTRHIGQSMKIYLAVYLDSCIIELTCLQV